MPLKGLAPLRWQQLIILVDGQQIPDAIERLRGAQEAIDERDILWFVNHRGRPQSNYSGPLGDALAAELKRQYFSRSDAAVFLIGKAYCERACGKPARWPMTHAQSTC